MNCTRCEGRGFFNLQQVDDEVLEAFDKSGNVGIILGWMEKHTKHDVRVCDCCGDGEEWYGTPGEHNDFGKNGSEPFPECY